MLIDEFFTVHFKKDLEVSEAEIQTIYQEGNTATVRHLLLLTKDKQDSAKKPVRRRMEALLARAKKGEDFTALVKRYSEYPGAGQDGGLMKDIERGDMVASFDSAAFTVAVGGLSGIFETEHGYHILKVIERKKDPRPLELVRSEIQTQVEKRRRSELYPKIREYIDQLKKENDFAVVRF
jgi:parvulin-like peptidyl-prolyl isomerase